MQDERRGRQDMLDRDPRIEELKQRVALHDYVVDETAVATAIMQRMCLRAGPGARAGEGLIQTK
jgi:hypothetical protein